MSRAANSAGSAGADTVPIALDAPIYFYVPASSWPGDLTPGMPFFWSEHRGGKLNWTLQAYEHLKRAGTNCTLVTELPPAGIIVAHRKLFPLRVRPSSSQLIVCIEADRGRLPFAQIHIQQNPVGTRLANRSWLGRLDRVLLGQRTNHFIYNWPQPGLIPRDPARGDEFRRIVFHGRERHLIPELRGEDFAREVAAAGLEFVPRFAKEEWADYSTADAVLAVRDSQGLQHLNKPAAKLYNAWHAGVPAILNPESAYLAESASDSRGAPLDFLPARTRSEVVEALNRLATNRELREALVARGRLNATRTTTENIARLWSDFLTTQAVPMFHTWIGLSEHARRQFFAVRETYFGLDQSRQRFDSLLSNWAGVRVRERAGGFELDDDS